MAKSIERNPQVKCQEESDDSKANFLRDINEIKSSLDRMTPSARRYLTDMLAVG